MELRVTRLRLRARAVVSHHLHNQEEQILFLIPCWRWKTEVLKFKVFAQDHSTRKWYIYSESVSNSTRKSLFFFYPSVSFPERPQVTAKWHLQSPGTSCIDIWQKPWKPKASSVARAQLGALQFPLLPGHWAIAQYSLYTPDLVCSLHHNAAPGLISTEGN